ncbi:hypothetical protein EV128_101607 [Rhizobium azibense]|nr:hypothetical protein EV128_101607 [Rhizobium azibense]
MPALALNRAGIGGYAIVMAELVKGVMEKQWPSRFGHQNGKALAEKLASVIKAPMLDMVYSISVYLDAANSAGLRKKALSGVSG